MDTLKRFIRTFAGQFTRYYPPKMFSYFEALNAVQQTLHWSLCVDSV